jgi:hypothetical protein
MTKIKQKTKNNNLVVVVHFSVHQLTSGMMFSSGPLDPDEFAINHRQQIALTTFVSNM